jgi:oligopeptide transport system substrate-binding protein
MNRPLLLGVALLASLSMHLFIPSSVGAEDAQASSSPSPVPSEKVLSVRLIGEPETLDWNRAHTPVETFILTNLMEGLVTFDSNMQVSQALAESWNISKDKKTYTFKLRPGVKWSDGVPLKAKDFVYSWKRLLSPATAAAYAYFLFDIVGAESFNKGTIKDFSKVGVKALNDSTLQVKLSHAIPYWIEVPTFWVTFPMRQDVVEKYGEKSGHMTSSAWTQPGKIVTLGPFLLTEHVYDSKIVLKSNPNYYTSKGNIDRVDFLVIKDDSTALNLYETGRLDCLTDISSVDLKRLAGREDLRSFPYYKTGYIGFVLTKPPLNNVHVRRAISMALDKAQVGRILHGGQMPANSWIPPRMIGHAETLGLPYDVDKAKEELKASGEDTSKPIELVIPNWDKPLILAQYIQDQLKSSLGLTINIQQFDHKTFRSQVDMKAFPLFILSWSADFPDPDNFMSVFLSDSGNNRSGWKNSAYDDLVLKARGISDDKVREKVYFEAQRLLLEEDAVVLPLFYEPNMALVRPRVQNLELNPLNYLLLRTVNLGS